MPKKELLTFSIPWVQVLDEAGLVDESLLPQTEQITEKTLDGFYESMVLIRAIDEKALNLQRSGRLGTYASILGQEAIQVGCAAALQKSDWFFPAFRATGISVLRGTPIKQIYQYWSGDERGSAIPEGQQDFPVSIPVGTHIPHAVGAAWAAKFKKDPIGVLCTFGDGATSKGDFHEGLNFAGIFKAPVVFVCQNNQYAISVPRKQQTASESIAQKAIAYGFEGLQVDGNDVMGVYLCVKEALEKARRGEGPTLIECVTYRLGDHTTADDASRYRDAEEVAEWKAKDPMIRLKILLQRDYGWSDKDDEALYEDVNRRIAESVAAYEGMEALNPLNMFDMLFEKLPSQLFSQRAALAKQLAEEKENDKKKGQDDSEASS